MSVSFKKIVCIGRIIDWLAAGDMMDQKFESGEIQNWHALSIEEVFRLVKSRPEGLTEQEVIERRAQFGPNEINGKHGDRIYRIFFRQFHNPFIYILMFSAAFTFFMGKIVDGWAVLGVVVLNAVIGFIQEFRSHRAIHALLQLIPHVSTVIRADTTLSVPSSELVVGDIVVLQAGDRVPADLRLIAVKNMCCDESSLTGESFPVVKTVSLEDEDAPLPERKCMAYNGTLSTSGSATGVVVATGSKSEFGQISKLLGQATQLATPLTETLERIALIITGGVILLGLAVLGIACMRGSSILEAGIASIALAVAAIPEGMPAAITIAAAIGVHRMARRNAVIRYLPAVETLGSTTVICTDKTGTLTQNEMTAQAIWAGGKTFFATGIGYSLEGEISPQEKLLEDDRNSLTKLFTISVLCNDASLLLKGADLSVTGDPTEISLLVLARKWGIHEEIIQSEYPRIDVIPFEPERRIMATLHQSPKGKIICVKGAPEQVLRVCKNVSSQQDLITKWVENMAKEGMRVLAVADKDMSEKDKALDEMDLKGDFSLAGLIALSDPPREGVASAIEACQKAGISVKMITGDHPLTAQKIGRDLGLVDGKVILGKEIDQTPISERYALISNHCVFARALPEHKMKIVEALQARGDVVAMTGDGVNDAPALKQADIGVAMGIKGTAVAKEASDMVLIDDNFISIKAAVEEGRRVYDNLVKSIAFIFPTNLAQALVIFFAMLFFPMSNGTLLVPILPVQILWINLIVSLGLSLPLSFEAMEPDIMNRPPRKRKAPLLTPFLWFRTVFVGVLISLATIALFLWEYLGELTSGEMGSDALALAQTNAVTTLVFAQMFYLFNCRSLTHPVSKIGFFSNLYVLLGIGVVLVLHLGFVYLPFMNHFLGSAPLGWQAWARSIFLAFWILPIVAIEKKLRQKSVNRL